MNKISQLFAAVAFFALAFMSSPAFSGATAVVDQKVVVSYVLTPNPGSAAAIVFTTDAAINSKATCNTQNRWAIDLTSVQGKAQYAAILAAYSMQNATTSPVKIQQIVGSGTCSIWAESENVSYIIIQQR